MLTTADKKNFKKILTNMEAGDVEQVLGKTLGTVLGKAEVVLDDAGKKFESVINSADSAFNEVLRASAKAKDAAKSTSNASVVQEKGIGDLNSDQFHLAKFYGVTSKDDLITAMEFHVRRMQAK